MIGTGSSNGTNGHPKALFAVALVTSLLWYFYWVVMASVEKDISEIINWYFFMKLRLRHVYDVYGLLGAVHNWCPLAVIMLYLLSKVSLAYRCFFTRLSQVIFTLIIVYNILMFAYLLFVGQKVAWLFLLALPLWTMITAGSRLSFIFATQHLFLASLPFLLLYFCFFCHFKFNKKRPSDHSTIVKGWWEPTLRAAAKRLTAIFVIPVCLSIFVSLIMRKGCDPCFSRGSLRLPKRPGLIAHRGCIDLVPENSMAGFEEAVKIPEIVGLETDVMISMDGVPFLLHDPHLVRTTDVETKCPSVDPFANASLLYYTNGSCPLMELNVGEWFVKEQLESGLLETAGLTRSRLETFSQQRLPNLQQFLELAKKKGKIVIFDLREPPVGHVYHKTYINQTLGSIAASGIQHDKVWWLTKDRRKWVYNHYPRIVQVTKTEVTKFEEFKEERIQQINDDWSIPLETFRKYQEANLSLNMYFVDSPLMFSYAWCVGAQTVTTGNCKLLSSLTTNPLYDICHFWHQELTPSYTWLVLGVGLFLLEILLLGCWEGLRLSRTGSSR